MQVRYVHESKSHQRLRKIKSSHLPQKSRILLVCCPPFSDSAEGGSASAPVPAAPPLTPEAIIPVPVPVPVRAVPPIAPWYPAAPPPPESIAATAAAFIPFTIAAAPGAPAMAAIKPAVPPTLLMSIFTPGGTAAAAAAVALLPLADPST
mmetsp:Transcript_34196/g.102313  ORF Transcript_34196/g.102313 Transcript_34196/m.102313 type:complete len:150 (+) Transcript_34196:109-558(+)